MVRESVRTEESITPPEPAKEHSGDGWFDGCGSLGRVDGAQGALIQPE